MLRGTHAIGLNREVVRRTVDRSVSYTSANAGKANPRAIVAAIANVAIRFIIVCPFSFGGVASIVKGLSKGNPIDSKNTHRLAGLWMRLRHSHPSHASPYVSL